MENKVIEFLEQSNFIEGVYDGLDQAVYAWEFIIKQRTLTIANILKCHKILMLHQKLLPNQKGYFRQCEVSIAGRLGAKWTQVPNLMVQWVKIANKSLNDLEIRDCHVKFEYIHPFVDGNGRIGRILLNYQRLRNKLDILIIKEENKYDYYKWFAAVTR